METEITPGMRVMRKTATTKPIIGVVKAVYAGNQWGPKKKPYAKVEWQDATLRMSGTTTTTSSVALDALLEATPEHINACIAKAQQLTPTMKSALKYWLESYGEEYRGLWEAGRPIANVRKQDTYHNAFSKLARLGYLEVNPEDKGKGSAHWTYRISQKGKEALAK
jgi:hypothetical protein